MARATPTSSATNRLNSPGVYYDAAGNLTYWNGASYEYDDMNQLKHYVSGTEEWLYMYDADDERLFSYKPGVPGQRSRFDRWTIRDLAGKVLRTYEATGYNWSGSVAEDDVYRDGLLLAAETPSGMRHFSLDHLGTPRLVTNAAGVQTAYHVYYPFGEEATAFNQDTERFKFTGHERDLASPSGAGDDLDYMHARHYSPVTGRFLTADRHPGSPELPRSWNRYAYSLGNPIKYTDPDGRCAVPAGLQQGQVGICIEAFIAAAHIGGIGLGDNRGFTPNDPKGSARISMKMIVDPRTGNLVRPMTVIPGHSDLLLKGLGRQGTASVEGGSAHLGDKTYFSLHFSGRNGLAPVTPWFGAIGFNVNMSVDASGSVSVDPSSTTKGFPSIEGYAYTLVNDQLLVQVLFQIPEQDSSKLKGPMDVQLNQPPPL